MLDEIWIMLMEERLMIEQEQTSEFRSCLFVVDEMFFTIKAWRVSGDWVWGVYTTTDSPTLLSFEILKKLSPCFRKKVNQ